jgi:peptidyl-prolyl cis-trans isomerase SurA
VILIETLRHMILRFMYSPAVLLLGTALVATTARSQSTTPAPAATQQSPTGSSAVVIEDILVRVNDQVISRSDYERADQQLQAELRHGGAGDAAGREKDLLRDLIDQQLLLSKGKELGITGETELIKQMDSIRKQNHLETMEDLEKAAQAQGVSFEDFKQTQRNSIIKQMVVRDEVGRKLQLSQADAQRYYDAHREEFDQPESVRLSEILIPTAEGDDAAKTAAAQKKADAIYAQLKGGADFAATAKSSSSGPTAQQGGDLGSFGRGKLAKELETTTFALNAGQYTEPIRTKQGFVILKVTEHPRAGTASFQEVESQVEESAYMEKMQPALRLYLTKLREEAFIDIKPGYVDTGASPNQTKPVYSAYTPPAPKKKKKVATTRYRETSHHGAAVAAGAATGAAVGSSTGTTQSAASTTTAASKTTTTATMKPGKKEKIRYGQAPRETLPPSAGETEHLDAGAAPAAATEQAAMEPPPVVPAQPPTPAQQKTRYSDRAKVPKAKKVKGPKVDPFAPPPATNDETATQKTQAAPLGLAGDTSKKPKKPKPTEKTRYSEEGKPTEPAPPAPSTAPSPVVTPATVPDKAPATTPDKTTAPAPPPAAAAQPQ